MESPPAKRQRTLTVVSEDSDSEDHDSIEVTPQTRVPARKSILKNNADVNLNCTSSVSGVPPSSNGYVSRKISRSSSQATTPVSSPDKRRTKTKFDTDGVKSRTLHTFFSKATERQRWERISGAETTPTADEVEDDIEDDSLDESELFKLLDPSKDRTTVLDRRKDLYAKLQHSGPSSRSGGSASARQKFKELPALESSDTNTQPWADEFAPADLSELAVHKKKVAEVRTWLTEAFAGRDRRNILILKGPAGSGKTTTLRLLSAALGFEVNEWKNPNGPIATNDGMSSMAAQFDDFLNRSLRFNALDLTDSINRLEKPENPTKIRITLLEEYPNSFAQSSLSAQAFRNTISRYLAGSTPSRVALFDRSTSFRMSPPLIMIISETLLNSSFASSDSFTAYRLLGPEIINHPSVCTIEFNAIAPTILSKALELVLRKEARKSGRRRIPGPAVLKQLSEGGDVRSAIGSLEFMCLRSDDDGQWGGRIAAKNKLSNGVALTRMEKESLEMVTQREASLGIFHAVGRVVYNKREQPKSDQPISHPPDHLPEAKRLRIPEANVEELIDGTGTDTQTFIAALHENFVLSCDGLCFTDSFGGCINALSDSDILDPSSFRGFKSNTRGVGIGRIPYQATNIESLRQDEASFQVAVRGLLFALPDPVKRGYGSKSIGSINGRPIGRGDAFKMFYPTSSRLWKQSEEIEGLLSTWIDRNMLNHQLAISEAKKTSSHESWKSRNCQSQANCEIDISALRPSRAEILLERLPFIVQMSTKRPLPADLDKLTKFYGVASENVGIEQDDAEDPMKGPPPDTPSRRRAGKWMMATQENRRAVPVENHVEKLVLSDDDIEDD